MFNNEHIEEAHNYAQGFCSDSLKPTPTWLTACGNKASATSAFQCITASATPAPSADANGKACFKFGDRQVFGKEGSAGQWSQNSDGRWQSMGQNSEQTGRMGGGFSFSGGSAGGSFGGGSNQNSYSNYNGGSSRPGGYKRDMNEQGPGGWLDRVKGWFSGGGH